ncbi:MAG: hypothetical protein IJU54_00760, partial [Alphaproteobacteria bacterium]|nr:hypothetical protein [Alphaproteobacteria bacterium]
NSIINTGSNKDTVPFVKSNKPRILTIGIPFDANNNFDRIDALTIPSNTIIHLSNIGNTKRYKFSNLIKNKLLSLVFKAKTEQLGDLKLINISNDEYLPIEYVEPIIINADYIISAKFDYNQGDSGKCIYHYPTTIKCDCGNTINLNIIDDSKDILSNNIIISRIGDIKCTNISCKNKLIKPNIVSAFLCISS